MGLRENLPTKSRPNRVDELLGKGSVLKPKQKDELRELLLDPAVTGTGLSAAFRREYGDTLSADAIKTWRRTNKPEVFA